MSRFIKLILIPLTLCASLMSIAACDALRQSPAPHSSPPAPTNVSAPGLPAPAAEALQRGDVLFSKGEYAQAIDEYTTAIQLAPDAGEPYNNRGLAYYRVGDVERAIADYNSALARRSDYANALTNRAIALFERGNYDGVIRDATRAIQLQPDDDSAYMFLGNAFERKGNYFAALRNWLQANTIRLARQNQ